MIRVANSATRHGEAKIDFQCDNRRAKCPFGSGPWCCHASKFRPCWASSLSFFMVACASHQPIVHAWPDWLARDAETDMD
jgi:hypothetical protein